MTLSTDDQLAIQDLYARYNHAIDSGNGDAWARTFTPDGTFASGANTFAGTEQLTNFAKGFASRMKARHWTNNLVIEAADGGAKGTCYLMLLRLTPGEQPPAAVMTTALYTDRLVKTADGWRFTNRSVTADA
jgi:ketosteroid isomerase-like protein